MQAEDMAEPGRRGSVVASGGLVLALGPGRLLEDEDEPGPPHVSFGRDQDIVGVPIDVRSARTGGAGGSALRVGRMPGLAVMPGRLPLTSGALTSRFGLRRHPIHGDLRTHSGVDLAAPTGTPVYAPSAGQVSTADWAGGYGLLVAIEHPGGMQTRYGHLSRIAVAPGQYVAAGSVIGYVGSTGNSTGPHLHYEVRINGQAVNPVGGR